MSFVSFIPDPEFLFHRSVSSLDILHFLPIICFINLDISCPTLVIVVNHVNHTFQKKKAISSKSNAKFISSILGDVTAIYELTLWGLGSADLVKYYCEPLTFLTVQSAVQQGTQRKGAGGGRGFTSRKAPPAGKRAKIDSPGRCFPCVAKYRRPAVAIVVHRADLVSPPQFSGAELCPVLYSIPASEHTNPQGKGSAQRRTSDRDTRMQDVTGIDGPSQGSLFDMSSGCAAAFLVFSGTTVKPHARHVSSSRSSQSYLSYKLLVRQDVLRTIAYP